MYYDKNVRYFENKKFVLYTGFILMVSAIVLFYAWPIDMDNVLYLPFIFMVILVTGCVMFFGSLMKRSSERNINEDIEHELKDFEEKAYFDLDMYGKELPYINSIKAESYRYYETPYVRRDREGIYRTDVYVKTLIYFSEDTLRAASRSICLTHEDTHDDYTYINYKDIVRAAVDPAQRIYTVGRKRVVIRYYDLNIYGENGILFSCQCRNDYTVECAVEDINNLAKKSRQ
ncbi:MAG: hypothetical protein J5879_01350 [Clostridia bacterium]|nr:hypothetical protein [Clostridia bacterium]